MLTGSMTDGEKRIVDAAIWFAKTRNSVWSVRHRAEVALENAVRDRSKNVAERSGG